MRKLAVSKKQMLAAVLALVFLLAVGCQEESVQVDAEALVREARTNANAISNCTATLTNTLNFSVDGRAVVLQTASSQTYFSTPYRMKNTQSSQLDGAAENTLSYTITEEDGVWFYSKNGDDEPWQKTRVQTMGTTPLEQVDILRLLPHVTSQKYVRSTTLNSRKVHKVELTFQSAAVRSMLETIVTASGIASGSQTIVPALLESAPEVYGYCYIAEDDAQIVRLELDATEALNMIFQKIDGASVAVTVSKAVISGDLSSIGKAEAVELPEEAKSAQESNAVG